MIKTIPNFVHLTPEKAKEKIASILHAMLQSFKFEDLSEVTLEGPIVKFLFKNKAGVEISGAVHVQKEHALLEYKETPEGTLFAGLVTGTLEKMIQEIFFGKP